MGQKLAKHGSDGRHILVWRVVVTVYGQADGPSRGKELSGGRLSGYGDAVPIVGREEAQVAGVGVAPARILDVVTVAVKGAVLAGLAWEIDLNRAGVGKDSPSHVGRRQAIRHLVLV